jgi:trigger factor
MASVEILDGLERRLNASIPQQNMQGEIESRLKRLGRTAKVHGFRPGKVPLKILEQQYGAQVHQEVLGENLERAFAAEAEANNLKVVGSPTFELRSADYRADPLEYSATFEIYPEVVIGDVGAETIERTTCAMSDSDVDNTIATLRKQRAVFELVDRPAQSQDRVRIDFTGKLDGEVFEGGEARDFSVELGSGRMLPDFETALIGMKAGETKSFDMTFPEDYHGKNVAGKQVTFTVTLHSAESPRLPELDSEFAKQMGIKDGDVEKLRSEIRENLLRELQRRIKVRNKDSAMDALLKVSKVELPKTLVNWEAQNLMQQTMRDMEERGVNIPKGMGLPPELFTERSQKRVKLGLVLSELIKQHDLVAKPEQVKDLIRDYAQGFDQPEQVMRWYTAEPSRMQEMENLALEDNVVAWIMGAAKVVDKAVGFDELMRNVQ